MMTDTPMRAERAAPRPSRQPSPLRALTRFFRSPKGLLLLVFAALLAVAVPYEGWSKVAPDLALAVGAAALGDIVLVYWLEEKLIFPSGAILTGLIVGMLVSFTEHWYVPVGTSLIAVASKYVFRTRWSNVFNPAAFALVVAYFVFSPGESWWGALPDLPGVAIVLLIVLGLFIATRINKVPMVLAFLGAFYLLFTATAIFGDPSQVAEVFRAPDANAALFFAFFMLDDPPTSPTRYGDQVLYALIVAVVSFAVYVWLGALYYLPAGLLVGNLWESLRRWDEWPRKRATAA